MESRWKQLKDIGVDYTHNTSIPGYRYLTAKIASERYFWYAIHACTLLTTYFLGRYTWDNFMMNPTITTVNFFQSYPARNVPMPGISVCNINKISRVRAEAYARDLSHKTGKSTHYILQGLKLLSGLNDYNRPNENDISFEFQDLLDRYDADPDGYYNTYDKLQMLQVPCSDMLDDCVLHDKERRCDELFVNDLTMEGHCCMFNYLSQSATNISEVLKENDRKPITAGFTNSGGLKFTLRYNLSDYMVTSLSTTGVKILVSLPRDFPDTTSGSLLENLVGVGEETFLRISSTVTFTTREVKKYPIDKRGCIFPDETDTIFGGYSSSDCIMDCKIKSIGAICQCTPFNYIKVFKSKRFPQCTLADLKCLSTYAAKWRTMYPSGFGDGTTLDKERQDAILCSNCVPACSDIRYNVRSDASELFQNGVVHVFFDSPFVTANKQDVFFYWYDMIGIFGGLCSLVMGVSFISVVELFYAFVYVFCKKLLSEPRPTEVDGENKC